MLAILRLRAAARRRPRPARPSRSGRAELADPATGLAVAAGRLVGVVSAAPEERPRWPTASGRYVDADAEATR